MHSDSLSSVLHSLDTGNIRACIEHDKTFTLSVDPVLLDDVLEELGLRKSSKPSMYQSFREGDHWSISETKPGTYVLSPAPIVFATGEDNDIEHPIGEVNDLDIARQRLNGM